MKKSMFVFKTMAAIAATVGVAAAPALAGDDDGAAASGLSPAEIVRTVESAGYTNIHDMEFDDGRWEIEATSPAGVNVDLQVDPANGKILHEETD